MVQSNRVTIITYDNAVYLDLFVYTDLDLSTCGIPANIHALQWNTNSGWIEYTDGTHNQDITELPQWALNCVDVWEARYNANPPTAQELADAQEQAAFYANLILEEGEPYHGTTTAATKLS
jgi:hypothetical protein